MRTVTPANPASPVSRWPLPFRSAKTSPRIVPFGVNPIAGVATFASPAVIATRVVGPTAVVPAGGITMMVFVPSATSEKLYVPATSVNVTASMVPLAPTSSCTVI